MQGVDAFTQEVSEVCGYVVQILKGSVQISTNSSFNQYPKTFTSSQEISLFSVVLTHSVIWAIYSSTATVEIKLVCSNEDLGSKCICDFPLRLSQSVFFMSPRVVSEVNERLRRFVSRVSMGTTAVWTHSPQLVGANVKLTDIQVQNVSFLVNAAQNHGHHVNFNMLEFADQWICTVDAILQLHTSSLFPWLEYLLYPYQG